MKVRFELYVRGENEDIITFDFSYLLLCRGVYDKELNELIRPMELHRIAVDIATKPLDTWEEYSETTDDGEPIYDYPKGDNHILFSISYYKEWRNKDRKYQIHIEGLQQGELCYAKYIR